MSIASVRFDESSALSLFENLFSLCRQLQSTIPDGSQQVQEEVPCSYILWEVGRLKIEVIILFHV